MKYVLLSLVMICSFSSCQELDFTCFDCSFEGDADVYTSDSRINIYLPNISSPDLPSEFQFSIGIRYQQFEIGQTDIDFDLQEASITVYDRFFRELYRAQNFELTDDEACGYKIYKLWNGLVGDVPYSGKLFTELDLVLSTGDTISVRHYKNQSVLCEEIRNFIKTGDGDLSGCRWITGIENSCFHHEFIDPFAQCI